jgi:hypothetical protein
MGTRAPGKSYSGSAVASQKERRTGLGSGGRRRGDAFPAEGSGELEEDPFNDQDMESNVDEPEVQETKFAWMAHILVSLSRRC